MSSMQQPFKAGHSHGQAKAKTEEWIETGKEAANTASEKTANAAQSAKDSAHQAKDESAGFLQQTGEQVMHMAQGAVESVKNTLGMNEKKN